MGAHAEEIKNIAGTFAVYMLYYEGLCSVPFKP